MAERDLVNINTATEMEMRQLPGIGPKRAARIMEIREQCGYVSMPQFTAVFHGRKLDRDLVNLIDFEDNIPGPEDQHSESHNLRDLLGQVPAMGTITPQQGTQDLGRSLPKEPPQTAPIMAPTQVAPSRVTQPKVVPPQIAALNVPQTRVTPTIMYGAGREADTRYQDVEDSTDNGVDPWSPLNLPGKQLRRARNPYMADFPKVPDRTQVPVVGGEGVRHRVRSKHGVKQEMVEHSAAESGYSYTSGSISVHEMYQELIGMRSSSLAFKDNFQHQSSCPSSPTVYQDMPVRTLSNLDKVKQQHDIRQYASSRCSRSSRSRSPDVVPTHRKHVGAPGTQMVSSRHRRDHKRSQDSSDGRDLVSDRTRGKQYEGRHRGNQHKYRTPSRSPSPSGSLYDTRSKSRSKPSGRHAGKSSRTPSRDGHGRRHSPSRMGHGSYRAKSRHCQSRKHYSSDSDSQSPYRGYRNRKDRSHSRHRHGQRRHDREARERSRFYFDSSATSSDGDYSEEYQGHSSKRGNPMRIPKNLKFDGKSNWLSFK
ncbi:uncharacterized protein LOC110449997 [Mizuhopecten yessoensis]|uniref:uncharacterized protein LOC110449997 n=1 Tax=Mizuhopecten yessoensis TaxID=6573 RepID=UPI000B45F12A|nr:uncharacterized protein LOC110449997 [Mizuhopecten yessoensis]